jgi:DNA adenine methylase
MNSIHTNNNLNTANGLDINTIENETVNNIDFNSKNCKLFSYVGSKDKYKAHFDTLLDDLDKKEYKFHIEAFAGSLASLLHNVEHIKAETIVINDFNPKIINLYKQIQDNPKEVIEKYLILENEFNRIIPQEIFEKYKSKRVAVEDREYMEEARRFYFEAREVYNNLEFDSNHAALLIFVMKHCFRGNYCENKQGKLNTSFNWSANKVNTEKVKTSIMNLHKFFTSNNVIFENLEVFDLINKYNESDTFIYLDPPYSNSKIQYQNRNRDKIVKEATFNEVSLHLQLIKACDKYESVMYSNHFEEEYASNFDNHLTFERTNKMSNSKNEKSKVEILAIKTNVIVPVLEKAKPITDLLGLSCSIDYDFKVVNNLHTPIPELLNISSISSNNSEYSTTENKQKIA